MRRISSPGSAYAFSVLGISGVIALVLYWAFRIYWYEAVFQFGILIYIALMFWGLICKVTEDIRFRMEQRICERMSTEDRLTGMKNRKAFEKYLQDCARDDGRREGCRAGFYSDGGSAGI